MKKAWVIGGVVAAHVGVIGTLVLCGGCGTVKHPAPATPPPPPPVEQPPVALPPPPPPVELPPPAVVTPPPVRPAPAPAELPTKKYTVKAGDSLSVIAKRFKVTKVDLMKMNKISDPDKIHIGQKLVLPGYVDLNAPMPVVRKVHKPAKPAAVAGGGEYAVVSGDTLGGIAYRHGTTIKALKEVNNLTSDKLQIGQKLALPQGSKAAGEAPAVAPAEEGVPGETTAVTEGAGAAPSPKSNELLHVVEPNQDLSSIAMMYGVRAEEIIRLNNLSSPDVKVGQTLKIPPPLE